MEFDWSNFTEEAFRELRKIVVESRQDDFFTEGKVGRLRVGRVNIALDLREEEDEAFCILLSYSTPETSGIPGASMRYSSDCLYFEFREEIERRATADIEKDERLRFFAAPENA